MDIKPFEAASLGVASLVVKQVDLVNDEPTQTEKKYFLVLDFNALALAMEKTGLDFAWKKSWQDLSPQNLLTLCWCAFQRFHPNVTVEEVGRMLSPADRWTIQETLMELADPGWVAQIRKAMEEQAGQSTEESNPGEDRPAAENVAP